MKTALVAGAVILAVAFASPALAKKKMKVDAGTCQSMLQQLDDAIASHASAPKIEAAKKDRAAGAANCSAGKYAIGARQYRAGLRALGVSPVHHR